MESRKLCLDCTLKHLGQAVVLLAEADKGYPLHRYIAMGHLAEAEDECISSYPEQARRIRDVRLAIQDGGSSYSIEELIEEVDNIKQKDGSGCGVC